MSIYTWVRVYEHKRRGVRRKGLGDEVIKGSSEMIKGSVDTARLGQDACPPRASHHTHTHANTYESAFASIYVNPRIYVNICSECTAVGRTYWMHILRNSSRSPFFSCLRCCCSICPKLAACAMVSRGALLCACMRLLSLSLAFISGLLSYLLWRGGRLVLVSFQPSPLISKSRRTMVARSLTVLQPSVVLLAAPVAAARVAAAPPLSLLSRSFSCGAAEVGLAFLPDDGC